MIAKNQIVIENIGKKSILADVSFLGSCLDKPVVIFCHGYKGFKDWGAWNLVADYFANKGFIFVKFNFSHNGGTLEHPIDFPDEESFGKNTYSQELEDLGHVIDYCISSFSIKQVCLIGHSRGGGISVLKAGQDNRVSKLCTWAGVSDFKSRFPKGEKLEEWKSNGVMYVLNGRTKQNLPHYYSFYEDFNQNEDKLDILKWAAKIKIPHLIIHGEQDEAVPLNEAKLLYSKNDLSTLLIMETNHTFGTKHPWDSDGMSFELEKMCGETSRFFGRL